MFNVDPGTIFKERIHFYIPERRNGPKHGRGGKGKQEFKKYCTFFDISMFGYKAF